MLQVVGCVPGAAPEPLQVSQFSCRGIRIEVSVPFAARAEVHEMATKDGIMGRPELLELLVLAVPADSSGSSRPKICRQPTLTTTRERATMRVQPRALE